ncbi:MAG TPA: hypothetical protein VMV84_03715 [Dehalococcoidales bacterium]|nr:hypothetical protein [Dehalococcoidales bacterium]
MPTVLAMSDFDLPTRSASGFLLRYIVPRVEPIQLLGVLVRRLPFKLAAPQADIIIGAGHGDVDVFTGQNEAIILEVGKYGPREVEGKVIKLLSCQCGVELCPDLVANGAACAIGYTDDYVWVMDSDLASTPWADKEFAGRCLMPVIDGLNALLDGKTAREALDIELEGYSRNAEVEEDELVKACLEFNHDNAILIGDGGASIRARPQLALPFRLIPPPPLLMPVA